MGHQEATKAFEVERLKPSFNVFRLFSSIIDLSIYIIDRSIYRIEVIYLYHLLFFSKSYEIVDLSL